MRHKRERIFEFTSNDQDLPKTVREYRAKFKGISQKLDEHPDILDRAHRDLRALSRVTATAGRVISRRKRYYAR